jgi:hypothetical protein
MASRVKGVKPICNESISDLELKPISKLAEVRVCGHQRPQYYHLPLRVYNTKLQIPYFQVEHFEKRACMKVARQLNKGRVITRSKLLLHFHSACDLVMRFLLKEIADLVISVQCQNLLAVAVQGRNQRSRRAKSQ